MWNLSRRAGLGYSPCSACCADLAQFLAALRLVAHGLPLGAWITWLTTYDRNPAFGHPTDAVALRRLAACGRRLSGPGWPPDDSERVWVAASAPPRAVAARAGHPPVR
jgi:hypothetical protein